MNDARWLPPTGEPESPKGDASPWHVGGGIFAVLLGIAAVVASESMKLDAETALLGGTYIKDGYRAALTGSGAALAALGALLLVLAAANANRSATRTTFTVTVVLAVLVAAEGAIVAAAVSEEQQEQTGASEAAPTEEAAAPTELDTDAYGESLEAAVSEEYRTDAEADCPTNGIDDRWITCTVSVDGEEGPVEATLDPAWELVEDFDRAAVDALVGE